jgi:hypothetical protein
MDENSYKARERESPVIAPYARNGELAGCAWLVLGGLIAAGLLMAVGWIAIWFFG